MDKWLFVWYRFIKVITVLNFSCRLRFVLLSGATLGKAISLPAQNLGYLTQRNFRNLPCGGLTIAPTLPYLSPRS